MIKMADIKLVITDNDAFWNKHCTQMVKEIDEKETHAQKKKKY